MTVTLALFLILACSAIAANMARVRDPLSAGRYKVLIGSIAVLGGCSVVWLIRADMATTLVLLLLATSWFSCTMATLNLRVNPAGSLFFALVNSIFVVLGLTEGRGMPSPGIMVALTLAWLVVGWLVRYDRVNPALIPILAICSGPLFL